MKVAVLGANWSPCAEAIDQMVVPATGLPSPSVHVKAVPPHSWTSIPRCRLYHGCSAGASLALKKMPPMPVTRFIEPPRTGGGVCFLRPNGLRLSGEGGEADRVRCSRGLDAMHLHQYAHSGPACSAEESSQRPDRNWNMRGPSRDGTPVSVWLRGQPPGLPPYFLDT